MKVIPVAAEVYHVALLMACSGELGRRYVSPLLNQDLSGNKSTALRCIAFPSRPPHSPLASRKKLNAGPDRRPSGAFLDPEN
jgi:hypothetical protein